MRYLIAILFAILTLWIASVFIGSHVNWRDNDKVMGLQLPVAGSSVNFFTEGCGNSSYGEMGLNPAVATIDNARKPFFLLHGDSYIEALQVADEDKPDAVLTRDLGGQVVAYGVGRSGYGFPSMIVRAQEYERVMGRPIAHVFFCASGIRNDVFEDEGFEFIRSNDGFAKRIVPVSCPGRLCARLVNQFHLNFVADVRKYMTERLIQWRLIKKSIPSASPTPTEDLGKELNYIIQAMTRQLSAPAVIVYCPKLPRIDKGAIHCDDAEQSDAELLRQCAAQHGISFIDTTPALLDLYDQKAIIARGFANCGGPGNGHLNEDGIQAVFDYVARQLKERYGI